MRLPDINTSRLVLIGSAHYESPDLPDVPAVLNNLSGMQSLFTDEGAGIAKPENCRTLRNPESQASVGEAIAEAAATAEDLLLIYFAGHGLLSNVRHDLFLATHKTAPGSRLPFTAVDFSHIRDVCRESSAKNKVVILDCCYSGRAIPGTLADSDPSSQFLTQVMISGTYTLTAAPANSVAKVHPGAKYTAFTGEILRILKSGVRSSDKYITLSLLYRELLTALTANGDPRPQQCGTETAERLALARNNAYADMRDEDRLLTHSPIEEKHSIPLSIRTFTPDPILEIPKVPRTLRDRDFLIQSKPHSWDYLLFASSLYLGFQSLEEKWARYEAGNAINVRSMSVAQLCRYLDDSLEKLSKITGDIEEALSQELQDRAFEVPRGQEDPELIMRMAGRLVGVYEDYLDWAMDIRGIHAPAVAKSLIDTGAGIADLPVRQVRDFILTYVSELDGLNRRYAESQRASVEINLTLKITLEEKILSRFLEERKRLN